MTTVTHEIDGAVGIVTLAKPPHNLIDDTMIDDLGGRLFAGDGGRLPGDLAAQFDASLLCGR